MTVRKFKNTWWVDFRVHYTRYRRRSPDNSKAGAEAYEATLRRKLAEGVDLRPPTLTAETKPTFAAFASIWFRDYVLANNKFSEQRAKRSILDQHLLPFFGRLPVDGITTHDIERFKARQVRSGASNKSIRNRLTILNKCLSCAHDWLELEGPPVRIHWPKSGPVRTDYLSLDECNRLLAAAEGLTYEMILTTLRTGMRQGEIKGLQWSSIDWQNRSVVVRHSYCDLRKVLDTPKSNRARHIPLDGEVLALLEKRRQAVGHVFVQGNGKPWSSKELNARLAEVCRAAGLRRVTWHVLRHTFASSAAMRGVPLQIVQHLLGHSTVKTTERYAHVAPSMLRVAIDLMSPAADASPTFGQPVGNQWSAALAHRQNNQAAQREIETAASGE